MPLNPDSLILSNMLRSEEYIAQLEHRLREAESREAHMTEVIQDLTKDKLATEDEVREAEQDEEPNDS